MTENQRLNNEAQQPEDDEINLLDLLIVLARHKKMIMGVTFVAALLSVGISLLLPNIYTGTTRILPPQQYQSSASAMLGQLLGGAGGGGVASIAGSALGLKSPNDLYVAMLKSQTIKEKIARRFDLQKIYEQKTMTETLKVLDKNTMVTSGKDGLITVEVDDKDPKRAAEMANAFIEELDQLMQTFSLTDAAQRRQFFETQMKPAKDKLTDAEVLLDKTPNTSLHYMDALRNLKYQESIYEILAKQFEMAKLDEAKDSPLIQILDKATVPERKSKPKRSLIVILATLVGFFIAMLWAFIREGLSRARQQPEQEALLIQFRHALRWKS